MYARLWTCCQSSPLTCLDVSTVPADQIESHESCKGLSRSRLCPFHPFADHTVCDTQACYALESQRRWCLSGTPLQNRLEDLFSLLCFLRMEPWGNFSFFRSSVISRLRLLAAHPPLRLTFAHHSALRYVTRFITVPFQKADPAAIEVVQFILESCLLRRDKTMRDVDGKLIVELPEKIVSSFLRIVLWGRADLHHHISKVTLERLEFSPLERKFYDSLYATAKRQYTAYQIAGTAGKNYGRILCV